MTLDAFATANAPTGDAESLRRRSHTLLAVAPSGFPTALAGSMVASTEGGEGFVVRPFEGR